MANARKKAKIDRAAARAGRPAEVGLREPSGRLSRAARKEIGTDSVAEIRRVRAAALSGMREPIWGTELGRLFLTGKITAEQFRAGRQWTELVARWRAINQAPNMNLRSNLVRLILVDPDDPKAPGKRYEPTLDMDEREATLMKLVNEVLDSFSRGATDPAMLALRECCELDVAPVGYGGMLLLGDGLDHLVSLWGDA